MDFIGKALSVSLPSMTNDVHELRTMAMSGGISVTTIGNMATMGGAIAVQQLNLNDFTKLCIPGKSFNIQCYANQTSVDKETNDTQQKQIKVVMTGQFPGSDLGDWAKASGGDTTYPFTVSYLMVSYDGKPAVELDPLKYVYKTWIDGTETDHLAEVRANLGM